MKQILPVEDIDRCVVVIFDIEGYSKQIVKEQTNLVRDFVISLDECVSQELKKLCTDVFSTGDGAIVSFGRGCMISLSDVEQIIITVESFVIKMQKSGLILRTAVHYSNDEKAVVIKNLTSIQGDFIQIGKTVNTASRIIQFCEPSEIIISNAVYEAICEGGSRFKNRFFMNEKFTTKHGQELLTYSYIAEPENHDIFYDPNGPTHSYKKYNYFPPISGQTVKFFMDIGLDFELTKVVSNAFESIKDINYTKVFVSWNSVVNVLIQLQYDPDDTVYVMSRNDRKANFWTQRNKDLYIDYLKKHAKENNGYINQTRVRVYDFFNASHEMNKNDIHHNLIKLHSTESYYAIANNRMFRYGELERLIFGVTISKKYHFAIIPVPSPESMDARFLGVQNIGDTLKSFSDYDAEHGPMKAFITADKRYVDLLIREFENMLHDSEKELLK